MRRREAGNTGTRKAHVSAELPTAKKVKKRKENSAAQAETVSKNSAQNFDVIIVGGGAAGMSAALWCEELGLRALLLESGGELGGQLLRVYNPIENHLGREAENGRHLRDIFVKQIEKRKFAIRLESKVAEIDVRAKRVVLQSGEEFFARALVIATGVRRRKLGVEGEEKFAGRGILESGKRDAEKVSGQTVCIVGGGDAALENALILSETAAKVYLVHRRRRFRAREEFVEKVSLNSKIEIFYENAVRKIDGETHVEAVEVENLKSKRVRRIDVQAVLIRIGVEPNTELLKGKVMLDRQGYVRINRDCETSVKGVFAVGDVSNPLSPTVSSAVGAGATAAKAIYASLEKRV